MVITATNVLALISSQEDPNPEIKASDINLIFNWIHSTPSMLTDETWTTMCIPGIAEEFLLHVYCNFYNEHLGVVFISTTDELEAFHQFSECARGLFYDIKSTGMLKHIVSWSEQWYNPVDMQELTAVLIRNNSQNQFVAYNFPKPVEYGPEEIELMNRFEEMYTRSLAHESKKNFFLIEREQAETFVVH